MLLLVTLGATRWWFDGPSIKVEQGGRVRTIRSLSEYGRCPGPRTRLEIDEFDRATITHAR
jgi:hypothetical protein